MADVPYIWWRGVRCTPAGRDAVLAAEQRAGFRFTITQGGFNAGGVAASAGTHDQEAFDFSVRGLTREQVAAMIEALRWAGFAAWFRTTSVGKWGTPAHGFGSYHVHAVPNGWGLMSVGARAQVRAYRAGRDGLRGNLADTGPGHVKTWYRQSAPRKPTPIPTAPKQSAPTQSTTTSGGLTMSDIETLSAENAELKKILTDPRNGVQAQLRAIAQGANSRDRMNRDDLAVSRIVTAATNAQTRVILEGVNREGRLTEADLDAIQARSEQAVRDGVAQAIDSIEAETTITLKAGQ